MRLNEGRKILGLDPDPSPAADVLMVMTGAGLVPIDANTLAGKKAALDAFGPPPASGMFGASPKTRMIATMAPRLRSQSCSANSTGLSRGTPWPLDRWERRR